MAYGEIDTSDAAEAGLFALPALFITFRETLEAAIIISVLLGLLEKVDQTHLKKHVWFGVLLGVFISVLISVIFIVAINLAKDSLLDDPFTRRTTEGIMSMVAAFLIGIVAVTLGNIMSVHQKWEGKLAVEMERQEEKEALTTRSIVLLAFTAVLREGLETLIFFTGVAAAYPPESLPIPAVVGAVIGVVIGVALYRFGGALTITLFFRFTMTLLVFIGAGMFTIGVHELQENGLFGTWQPEEDRTGLNLYLWDIRDCCALETNEGWVMFRVLFGYTPNPTGVEAIFYVLYHIVVWCIIAIKSYMIAHNIPSPKARLKAYLRGERITSGSVSEDSSTGPNKDAIKDLDSSSSDDQV